MVNEKVDILLEQTSFLYERQKELLEKIDKAFAFLLKEIDEKSKVTEKDSSEFNDLKVIYTHLTTRHGNLQNQIQEDIGFLEEQLKAIESIKTIESKEKAEEVFSMIIGKEEKLQDTQEFKDNVLHDLSESEKELKIMEDDFLNALQENKLHELKLLLQAAQEQEKEEAFKTVGCCDESACSSCSSSSCSDDDNTDIFDTFTKKDEEK